MNDEANTPETPETETEANTRKVAERGEINAKGELVEHTEDATGIKYTYGDEAQSFVCQLGTVGEPLSHATLMLAVFGAKTLAGNIASAWSRSKDTEFASAYEAIAARFGLIGEGTWIHRGEGKRAPKWDLDILAQAIANAKGVGDDDAAVAEYRKALEDAGYKRKATNVEVVVNEYYALAGKSKPEVSLDDI